MRRWSEPNAARAPAGEQQQVARRGQSNGDRSGERSMKTWTRRYAVSCLLALFVLSGIDAYNRPTKDVRIGSAIIMAAVWPVVLAIAVGGAVGEVAREHVQS
jgi:hypothetical protein